MNNFNAKQARELVNYNHELLYILDSIERVARRGYSKYYVYNNIKNGTISGLVKRGFMVRKHPSLNVQVVSW